MRHKRKFFGLLFCSLTLVSPFLGAQELQTGAIKGKVVDEYGQALPGVFITVIGPSLLGKISAVTNEAGIYRAPALPPGRGYEIKAELEGFETVIRKGIIVTVRPTVTIDFKMKPATLKRQDTGWTNKPLTKKEIPVAPDRMANYLWQQIKKDSYTKQHFGWKLAFIQHPMYLLIDEDRGVPAVAERIPPWGAANADDYAGRVRRNLNSLKELPGLKLNFEWSACELQSIIKKYPDIFDEMKRQFQMGSLDFVNGTYSQPHLQVLSSESNWRQFEYGLEIYRDLFDKKVDVYAAQETSLHQQLPQILKKFGYKYILPPDFPFVLEFVEGKIELLSIFGGKYQPISGNEFVNAIALDGSVIPAYLNHEAENADEYGTMNYQFDLFSTSKISTIIPDLEEVDKSTFEYYNSLFDFVNLKDALDERYKKVPPQVTARLYSYWSYAEGVWAEELLRKIRKAEEFALLAEELNSMGSLAGLNADKSADIKENWATILKSQHHDISWIEVTDLRKKSINRLDSVVFNLKNIMSDIAGKLVDKGSNSMSVFNGLSHPRRCKVELDGKKSLGKNSDFQEFGGKSIGFVSVPAGGFKSFTVAKNSSSSVMSDLPHEITTKYYKVEFSDEGLITQLSTINGKKLLCSGEYLGGEIRARIADNWVNNRKAKIQYYKGPVCDILIRNTNLGEIPMKETYYFFKKESFIKAEIEFDFSGNEVGNMWIDKSKINIYYPTEASEIYYDVPFGFVQGKKEKPLFVTNWLYCDGLVYVNRGTVKHWIENGVMANVVAWGSNHFTNRVDWDGWLIRPQYDLRLYGKQKIEYYLIPYDGFDATKIISDVEDIITPVFIYPGKGEKSFYQVENKDLHPTAIYLKDGKIWVRGYKIPSPDKSKFRDFEIFDQPLGDFTK